MDIIALGLRQDIIIHPFPGMLAKEVWVHCKVERSQCIDRIYPWQSSLMDQMWCDTSVPHSEKQHGPEREDKGLSLWSLWSPKGACCALHQGLPNSHPPVHLLLSAQAPHSWLKWYNLDDQLVIWISYLVPGQKPKHAPRGEDQVLETMHYITNNSGPFHKINSECRWWCKYDNVSTIVGYLPHGTSQERGHRHSCS
jgi:hypothetical protein